MKKNILIVLFTIVATTFSLNVSAQRKVHDVFFSNEKLRIDHSSQDGRDGLLFNHSLGIYNLTNNRMRVTYKVKGATWCIYNGSSQDACFFEYTRTVYIEPQGVASDTFMDEYNKKAYDYYSYYFKKGVYDNKDWRMVLHSFELVNYGVEQRNYETSY